jgi:hypothetical protein
MVLWLVAVDQRAIASKRVQQGRRLGMQIPVGILPERRRRWPGGSSLKQPRSRTAGALPIARWAMYSNSGTVR